VVEVHFFVRLVPEEKVVKVGTNVFQRSFRTYTRKQDEEVKTVQLLKTTERKGNKKRNNRNPKNSYFLLNPFSFSILREIPQVSIWRKSIALPFLRAFTGLFERLFLVPG